jgi:hypothetical protein
LPNTVWTVLSFTTHYTSDILLGKSVVHIRPGRYGSRFCFRVAALSISLVATFCARPRNSGHFASES